MMSTSKNKPTAQAILNEAKAMAGPDGSVAVVLSTLMGKYGYGTDVLVRHAIAAESYALELEQEIRKLRRELEEGK